MYRFRTLRRRRMRRSLRVLGPLFGFDPAEIDEYLAASGL